LLRSETSCFLTKGASALRKSNILWTILIAIIYSCTNNLLNPIDSHDYFPLQIGNEWSYEYFFRTPARNVLDYKITEKKKIKENEYYAFNQHMPFFPDLAIIPSIREQLLRQDVNGNIMVSIDSTEYLYFIFNNAPVDSMIKMKLADMDYWLYTESKDETVETTVGIFHHCYKMLCYFPQIIGTEYFVWFAPGYGPVKIYYPELDITYKLIHIKIN
jgi:hypothetical protein